jgi:hypothetical protein
MKKIKQFLCEHEWMHIGYIKCKNPKYCNIGMHYCIKCNKEKRGKFK